LTKSTEQTHLIIHIAPNKPQLDLIKDKNSAKCPPYQSTKHTNRDVLRNYHAEDLIISTKDSTSSSNKPFSSHSSKLTEFKFLPHFLHFQINAKSFPPKNTPRRRSRFSIKLIKTATLPIKKSPRTYVRVKVARDRHHEREAEAASFLEIGSPIEEEQPGESKARQVE